MPDIILSVPRKLRRGGKGGDEAASVESAKDLIELLCRVSGVEDLSDMSILDVGCGCKVVQAILNEGLPVGRYTGIDVFPELIEYLQSQVNDPRFHFHTMNIHNEMYNPEGEPLSEQTALPLVGGELFDIICLFSVFTHLAPHDYSAMLRLLRPYIKPGGKLVFSLFVHEETAGGHGFIDDIARVMIAENIVVAERLADEGPPDFLDWDASKPLFRAIYSRKHALELIEGSGWALESLNDPEENIQHFIVCSPT